MTKIEERKQIITEKIADHLLAHGMKNASLRPLAAVAGTSDRMLLHYFANKEELMTATLLLVTERLMAILSNTQSEQLPFQILLPHLAKMISDPHIRPYLRLWLELAASAAGGEEYYRTIARQICDIFFDWIASALKVEREEDRISLAAFAFATIEGFVLLDMLGYDSLIACGLGGVAIR